MYRPAVYYTYNDKNERIYKVYADIVHRDDGPAIISTGNHHIWVNMGVYHRENGPAIMTPVSNSWYLNGVTYVEYEYYRAISTGRFRRPPDKVGHNG